MAVKGVFASDAHIVGNRKGDFASGLLQVMPTGTARLLALTAGMESSEINSTITTWFEENHVSGRINITSNAGTGVTATVDDASTTVVGTVYMVESTGEYLYVDNVVGTTLTLSRGFADTTAAAIDGSVTPVPIQRISTAFEEGSSRPQGIANIGYPRFNYVQTFRNSWDVTGVARNVEYYTGDLVAKSRRDASLYHSEDIERALIWGRKTVGIKNSKPFRTMDGLNAQIITNVAAQATNTTWDNIDTFLQSIFARNIKGQPNERIAYCGNTVISVLNHIAKLAGKIELPVGQTEFGLEIHTWRTPYGTISLMTHPLMNESPFWTKDLYVYHPGAIKVRYLRRTFEDNYDKDGTRAGVDADYGVFTADLTVEYKGELTGGKYTGIDTAA